MEQKKKHDFSLTKLFFCFFFVIAYSFAISSPSSSSPSSPFSSSPFSSSFSSSLSVNLSSVEIKKEKIKSKNDTYDNTNNHKNLNKQQNIKNKNDKKEKNDEEEEDRCFTSFSSFGSPSECLLYSAWEADPLYKIKENVYRKNFIFYKNVADISNKKEIYERRRLEEKQEEEENNHPSKFSFSLLSSTEETQEKLLLDDMRQYNNTEKIKKERKREEEKNEEKNEVSKNKTNIKARNEKKEKEESKKKEKQEETENGASLESTYKAVVRALAPFRLNLAGAHKRNRKTQQEDESDETDKEGGENNNNSSNSSHHNNKNAFKNTKNNKNNSTSTKAVPSSNGLECIDNPMVEEFGTKCRLIARNFGDKLGCNKKLIDLSPDGYLPPGIPQFSRVADACPDSCGLCEECAPGCALWFIGNTMCDPACNNAACQYDGGDCWSADCVVSEWGEWSDCSVTCGGPGIEKRTRKVKSRQKLGGKPCPKLEETRNECNADVACPIDCLVGDWSSWGPCSATCGAGISERRREIVKEPDVNGGRACPELVQNVSCFLDTCKTDCIVTDWGDWHECSKTCGGGAQIRRREIKSPPTSGGSECPNLEESRECNTFSCDSGCEVSEWGKWSECSEKCGGGKQKRKREILTKNLEEADCPPLTQETTCNTHECAVDCEVGEWQEWGECSMTCGEGTSARKREILKEKGGLGDDCPDIEQTRKCFLQPCGDQCIVSEWGEWSACTATCGEGIKKRSREITTYPSGKAECPNLTEIKECVNRCELQCVVAEWTTWSSCEDVCTAQNSFSPFQDANNIFAVRTKNILLYTPNCPDPSTLVETQPCSQLGIVCDVNCVMGDWTAWTTCSQQCGGGTRARQREVTRNASGNGLACSETSQTQPCGTDPCPAPDVKVDCKVGEWSGWSECDASCGGGRQAATRQILAYPANGGAPCPDTEKFTVGCNNHPCAEDCLVTQWTAWSSCSATCGGGKISRSRSPIKNASNGGKPCPPLTEQMDCATYPCPTDCVMADWGEWSDCSVTCGVGVHTRTRQIKTAPSQDPPGLACGPVKDTASCLGAHGACDKDCVVSDWGDWSECSATCGPGHMYRTRQITDLPTNKGKPCPEDLQSFNDCNTQPCEIDCKVSDWSEWSECSVSCVDDLQQGGTRIRTRSVIRPPREGGEECPELEDVDSKCNAYTLCPTDCEYDMWSEWGECSATCGMGQMKRERGVLKYPTNGGKECDQLDQVVNCLAPAPCVIACEVGEWGEWGDCSATCGGGSMKRSREVTVPPANGGTSCPPLDEYDECNTHSCGGVDCEVSDWSEWTTCTKECGGGVHSRKRKIITPASGAGEECPVVDQRKGCNLQRCPGVRCEDNEEVPKIAKVSCKLLAAQGCDKTLAALAVENNIDMPADIPPETRIKDACPASCDVCKECAPGCELRDLGNRHCDEACMNDDCQNDLGDCGGDCPLPPLPQGVSADPPAANLAIEQSLILSCDSNTNVMRFKNLVALRQIALTCTSEKTLDIYPEGIKLKQTDDTDTTTLEIPSCVQDSCPYIFVNNFDEEYKQFNGVYGRGDAVRGHPRYIQLDTEVVYHLWVYPFSSGSPQNSRDLHSKNKNNSKFAWRITTYNPAKDGINITGEEDEEDEDEDEDYNGNGNSVSAAGTGVKCLTPDVGQDAPLDCVTKWIIGIINSSNKSGSTVTAEVTNIKMKCVTEEEKDDILESMQPSVSPSSLDEGGEEDDGVPPETVVGGMKSKCEDRAEVEEMSKKKCPELKKMLGCDFLLKDTGADIPDFVPEDAPISAVCPQTCGMCVTCAPKCPKWFLGNGYCDETCNNEECEFDKGDCGGEGGGKNTGDDDDDGKDEEGNEDNTKENESKNDTNSNNNNIVNNNNNNNSSVDPSTDCEDDSMVTNMGYSCLMLQRIGEQTGKGGCDAKLIDLAPDDQMPSGIPPITRVKDACPKTCKYCDGPDRLVRPTPGGGGGSKNNGDGGGSTSGGGKCKDNALIEEKSGYTCQQIKKFVNNDCSKFLADIAGNADMMAGIDRSVTLAEACPKTCGVCTEDDDDNNSHNNKDCIDNPIVQQYSNFSCEEIVNSVGCDALLKDIHNGPLPDGVPEQTRVKDACIKTCNACPDSVDTSVENECYDDPRVSRMGYTCQLFLQFAREGCNTKINDLLGSSNAAGGVDLPEGIIGGMYIKDVCRLSCGVCKRTVKNNSNNKNNKNGGGDGVNKIEGCSDSPMVENMGFSCSLLIQYGANGCNSLLKDLSSEPLPASIPPNTRVKDACMESCGLCREVVTCDDGYQNGDEEGVDCGGSCRPCRSCSSSALKSMGGGSGGVRKTKAETSDGGGSYMFEGSGLRHNDIRIVKCKEGYEKVSGKEGENITCLDGVWQKPTLKCSEKKIDVHTASLTLINAYDFGPDTVPSIYSALANCLSIRSPDELRILSIGPPSSSGNAAEGEGGEDECVDSPLVERMGYSCEMLSAFCDKVLEELAASQGASLPDGIPEGAQVKDACPVTCGVCVPSSRLRMLGESDGKDSNALSADASLSQIVDFALILKNNNIPIEKRFTDNITERFITQLANQFIARNVKMTAINNNGNNEEDAIDILHNRPILATFSPHKDAKILLNKWDKAYNSVSTELTAQAIFHYAGLPLPSKQKITYFDNKRSSSSPSSSTNKYIPNVSVNYNGGEGTANDDRLLQIAIVPGIMHLSGVCTTMNSVKDPTSCCQLEIEFKYLLEGECGNLLYTNALQKSNVKEFCEGKTSDISSRKDSCYKKFLRVVDRYTDRAGSACELVSYSKNVVGAWCAQDPSGAYCFPSIGKTMKSLSLQSLVTKSSSELESICSANGCYRTHIKYLDSLTQIQLGWQLAANILLNNKNNNNNYYTRNNKRRSRRERRLFDSNNNNNNDDEDILNTNNIYNVFYNSTDKYNNNNNKQNSSPLLKYDSMSLEDVGLENENVNDEMYNHMYVWTNRLKSIDDEFKVAFMNAAKSIGILHTTTDRNEENVTSDNKYGNKYIKLSIKEARARRLSTLNNIMGPLGDSGEDVLNLVCTRVDGDFCQQTLLLLIEDSPVKNPTLVVQPCARRCFVPITGQLGTLVESYGAKYVDPFSEILGKIMRGYGRFYCQQNEAGKLCGEHIFNKIKIIKSTPYNPEGLGVSMPECRCQESFLQDGECDAECFSAACGWDGEDCLLQRMFPEIYMALTSFVDENCLFYKTNFECSAKCRAQYDTARNLEKQGCCFTSALEVLGGLLETEEKHPLVNSSNQWRSNRNIAYLEQTCVATFDRTCSTGRQRKLLKNEMYIENVKSDFLMSNVDALEKIKKILRTTITQKLRLVDADINRMVVRRSANGLAFEYDIDCGNQAERVQSLLKNESFMEQLGQVVSRRLSELDTTRFRKNKKKFIRFLFDPSSMTTVSVASPPIQFEIPPPLPYVGTLGMSDLQINMLFENCTLNDMFLVGKGYTPIPLPDDVNTFAHGARRTVRCASSYDAISGSNPDKLECNNGKWVFQNFLECRKACKTFPPNDIINYIETFNNDTNNMTNTNVYNGTLPMNNSNNVTLTPSKNVHTYTTSYSNNYLGKEYKVTGIGTKHGSYRKIECEKGYAPHKGMSPVVLYCDDGSWDDMTLICKATCPPFEELGNAFIVKGEGTIYKSRRHIYCANGYYPKSSVRTVQDINGTATVTNSSNIVGNNLKAYVECIDGAWTPLSIDCVKPEAAETDTNQSAVARVFNQIFSGPGILGALVVAIVLVVMAISIFIAWKVYFRKKAKKNLEDREHTVEKLKRSKAQDFLNGGGVGFSNINNYSNIKGKGENYTNIEDKTTNWESNERMGGEKGVSSNGVRTSGGAHTSTDRRGGQESLNDSASAWNHRSSGSNSKGNESLASSSSSICDSSSSIFSAEEGDILQLADYNERSELPTPSTYLGTAHSGNNSNIRGNNSNLLNTNSNSRHGNEENDRVRIRRSSYGADSYIENESAVSAYSGSHVYEDSDDEEEDNESGIGGYDNLGGAVHVRHSYSSGNIQHPNPVSSVSSSKYLPHPRMPQAQKSSQSVAVSAPLHPQLRHSASHTLSSAPNYGGVSSSSTIRVRGTKGGIGGIERGGLTEVAANVCSSVGRVRDVQGATHNHYSATWTGAGDEEGMEMEDTPHSVGSAPNSIQIATAMTPMGIIEDLEGGGGGGGGTYEVSPVRYRRNTPTSAYSGVGGNPYRKNGAKKGSSK